MENEYTSGISATDMPNLRARADVYMAATCAQLSFIEPERGWGTERVGQLSFGYVDQDADCERWFEA